MAQPIIRGVQSVGAVDVFYKYNGTLYYPPLLGGLQGSSDTEPTGIIYPTEYNTGDKDKDGKAIIYKNESGLRCVGFQLDGEFLRANPQIASSVIIPILGGGGVALTNNNRTGTLTIQCPVVSTPKAEIVTEDQNTTSGDTIAVLKYNSFIGAIDGNKTNNPVYEMSFLARCQQAQPKGDSVGSTICIHFNINGMTTRVQFESCTVSTVDPVALAGNQIISHTVVFNYLNWRMKVYDSNNTATSNFIE